MACKDTFISSKRGRIFIRDWSPELTERTPIILIHDSLGCVELWRDFPSLLSEITNRRVIAYDRLGFGKSDALDEPIASQFIANEAMGTFAHVLQYLKIQKFIVLGHSVGGGMALHCATHYPEQCEAVITIAAQAFVEDKTLEGIKIAQELFKDPSQVERLKKYHGDKAQWVLDSWIHSWLGESFANWSLSEALPKVTASLFAIHGVNDEYGSTAHPQRITNLSSGKSTLMLMENTGHFPHREQTQAVLDAIKEFLD